MLAHGFHEMLKKKNFDFKKLPRGQSSKGNKGIKTMSQTLQLTVLSACCGQQGHMMKDYQFLKKEAKKKKPKGKGKKTIIVAQGDNDSVDSPDEEDDIANLCLMANGQKLDSKYKFSKYFKLTLKGAEGTSIQLVKTLFLKTSLFPPPL